MARVYKRFRVVLTCVVFAIAIGVCLMPVELIGGQNVLHRIPEALDTAFGALISIESAPVFWPIVLAMTGLVAGMWLDEFVLRVPVARRARPYASPLEIVYDPNDHRCVHREFPNGELRPVLRFKVGLRNATGTRPLHDIIVTASANAFVRSVIAPAWGGRTRRVARIEPNATEFVDILDLPEGDAAATNAVGRASRFVIRASASDTRRTSAKFVFDVHATPAIRRVS